MKSLFSRLRIFTRSLCEPVDLDLEKNNSLISSGDVDEGKESFSVIQEI